MILDIFANGFKPVLSSVNDNGKPWLTLFLQAVIAQKQLHVRHQLGLLGMDLGLVFLAN
jgi:hypothetical protein